ncbi:SH3 domain-containing protein [Sinomicrobium weinanense]|uniref:SH3 domain-containing protein n=1 Tax=Sinomicrobium weinanense TaxID=2842200 RepID=A0A926JPS0_9FLAO|nr:SH3 domain-containing protein [Sinomicrobium weinanense]MBC9795230.1 SH3 domain-containing protein [Sinomicrobium weinanense]MBU3122007.1 SH3 domain-containing protein [Sinomicrobium weinanense]
MDYENGPLEDTIYFPDSNAVLENGYAREDGTRHGLWCAFYKNGNLRAEGIYQDGKKEGTWKMYDLEKRLLVEGQFRLNFPDGVWVWYDEKGEKRFERTYKNGFKEGTWKGYYPDGNLYGEARFAKSRLLEGKMFSPDGREIPLFTLGKLMERIVLLEGKDGPVKGEKPDSRENLWRFAINSKNPDKVKELADNGVEIRQGYIDTICEKWYQANQNGGGYYGRETIAYFDTPQATEAYRNDFGNNYFNQLEADKQGAFTNYEKQAAIIRKCRDMLDAVDRYDIVIRKRFIVKILSADHAEDARFTGEEVRYFWKRGKISVTDIMAYPLPIGGPEKKDLMEIALDSFYMEPTIVQFLIEKGYPVNKGHFGKIAAIRENYYRDLIPDEDGVSRVNYSESDIANADRTLKIIRRALGDLSLPDGIIAAPENINMRVFPSSTSRIVETVSSGTLVRLLSPVVPGDWVHIRLEKGKRGYVLGDFLVKI